jgi:hypothetical protein
VEIMQEKTRELINKFEEDYEICVSAIESMTSWIIYARVPRNLAGETYHLDDGKKYVSGPNDEGNVLILPVPRISGTCLVESWGPMETIDDFVKKALVQIVTDKNATDKGQEEGCGTSCG